MDVILLEKVINLGDLGETVSVKPGFARNFLMPQGMALAATKANREHFESRRAELEAKAKGSLLVAESRREKLVELGTVPIPAHAGNEGKLFGSVTAGDIADAILLAGVEVTKREIRLDQGSLREVGEYDIVVRLHPEVEHAVAIAVVPSE